MSRYSWTVADVGFDVRLASGANADPRLGNGYGIVIPDDCTEAVFDELHKSRIGPVTHTVTRTVSGERAVIVAALRNAGYRVAGEP